MTLINTVNLKILAHLQQNQMNDAYVVFSAIVPKYRPEVLDYLNNNGYHTELMLLCKLWVANSKNLVD